MSTGSRVTRIVYLPDTEGDRIEVLVTKSPQSKRIIVTVPDPGDECEGFKGIHNFFADSFARHGIGAVIQMPNRYPQAAVRYARVPPKQDIAAVCGYAGRVAKSITSVERPILWLMGFPKGDSERAAISAKHNAISQVRSQLPRFKECTESIKSLKTGIMFFGGNLSISDRQKEELVLTGWGQFFAPWQFEMKN